MKTSDIQACVAVAGGAFLAAFCIVVQSSCAEMKPILHTASEAASVLCGAFFAEKRGLSFDDAAKTFCSTEAQLKPWLDELLAAKRRVGARYDAHPKATTVYIDDADESDGGHE